MNSFDDILEIDESEETLHNDHQPIWSIKLTDKEAVHKWLKDEFRYLLKINNRRHNNMIENLLIYQGIQFDPDDQKTINDFLNTSRHGNENDHRKQKLFVNHLHDLTETMVARSTRNKPVPEVVAANSNEIQDRNAARTVLQILNYLAHINDLSTLDIKNKRMSKITGESFISAMWNKDLGDIHPLWAQARDVNFIDEDGDPIVGPDGKKLDPKKPLLTGEAELKIRNSWTTLLDEKDEWEDVNYSFIIEHANVEELKKDFPKSANEIKAIDGQRIFDTQKMTFRRLRNTSLKITFHHKKTKYLPDGLEIIFTPNVILEQGPFPYDHNKLALIRLTDLDIPGRLHGISFYELTKNMQWRHNQLSGDIITNQRMCAKPKWLVPKGRTKLASLGDAITIVQYSGQIPPKLVSINPTPSEIFLFRDKLKEEMEQISTVTGTSRREPPTGVTASVSLRFLTELEAERGSVEIFKQNNFIKEIYTILMSIIGTYYDPSDGRTMRVLGNDNEFHIKNLQVANLNKPYDVIIRNIGNLPEMRASKEARLFDTLKLRPKLLSDEQLIESLDLGSVEKVTTILTESIRAAEGENEKFFNQDEEVLEPAVYEDHITHWRSHVQKLQSLSVKENARVEDLTALEQHIFGTEFLMIEKAKKNPTFNAELANLKLFPIFYSAGGGFTPSSKEQQQAVVQGQANRGEPLTEKIGGTPLEGQPIRQPDIQSTDKRLNKSKGKK